MRRIFNTETKNFIGKRVKVCGWVDRVRAHGKIIFLDLRDKSGILQIVFDEGKNKVLFEKVKKIRSEWVISVEGEVRKRPEKMINPKIETGDIELEGKEINIFSQAKTLPFPINTSGYEIEENIRLKYRYLDLRRERLKKNLEVRQRVIHFMRSFLIKEGFLEVETPILTKSTPEGARDFLVPSRLYPGKFYALPQSPQQYKQLLMVSGIERYFQIARCLRDEDPRADRQPEFTQLDIEMSFVGVEDILDMIERLFVSLIKNLFPKKRITKIPFPRISYEFSIKNYHSDRPDLRENKSDEDELSFCFVTDFPMFEWKKEEKRWGAMHHPFTKPKTEDIERIKKDPKKILAYQYDVVLNGEEIGGGSIRNTNLDLLLTVFEVLGYSKEEIKEKFSHYFEAFSYGVPPHGGIAIGIERFLKILLKEENIREVIAFPKTGDNRDLMLDIPSKVSKEQLKELSIEIRKDRKR